MHYYKRNLGDYAKKTGRLTMLQHGAYTLLLDACYDREQFPTREEAIEWTWASTTEEREAVEFVLDRFFELVGGRYVQNRIREELAKFQENSDTNKRIAIEREAKRREKSTNRAHTVDGDSTLEHEPPPNHKPLTNNQDTETNVSVAKTASSPECPQQEILALWAEVLPSAIQPREWTPSRQAALRARWRERPKRQSLDWWRKLFEYITESDFLMGRSTVPGRRAFDISLDWVLKAENFAKVMEGRYHGKEAA